MTAQIIQFPIKNKNNNSDIQKPKTVPAVINAEKKECIITGLIIGIIHPSLLKEELVADKDIALAILSNIPRNKYTNITSYIDSSLLMDKEFILKALDDIACNDIIPYINKKLFTDSDFIINACAVNYKFWQYHYKKIDHSLHLKIILRNEKVNIFHLPDALQADKQFMISVLRTTNIDYSFIISALRSDPDILKVVSETPQDWVTRIEIGGRKFMNEIHRIRSILR